MAITVIARNNTGSSINLDDLGITLISSETRILTDYFDYIELTESTDLFDNVSNGNITINDGNIDLNITEALQHLSFESEYQDLKQDESISGGITVDLACCDISTQTSFSVNSSWQDTIYTTVDIENDPNVIEHGSNGITIKETGIYNIVVLYSTRVSSPTFGECLYRIIKNGTTPISYEKRHNLYKTEIHNFVDNITRKLNEGDFISSQTKSDDDVTILSGSLKITKLEGVKGEQGVPGGTTIEVQEDDNTITTNTNTLNFEGNVNVINNGGNKATIQISNQSHEFKYITVYDSHGGINVNTSTATRYSWDSQLIRDSDVFDHSTVTNPSRIYLLKDGFYKLSYCITYDSTNNNRKNIKCFLMENGSDIVKLTSTASYTRNNYDDYGSNTLPPIIMKFQEGTFIELYHHREGSYGNANTYANECWLQIEYIRG
jgi:hypothetical protein